MIEAEVIGLQEFGAKLGLKVSALDKNLGRAMREITMDLVGQVKANKLSGQVLKVRTGRLRRSVTGRVNSEAGVITGEVGTNVDYGLIHEFGGEKAKASFKAQFVPKPPFPKRAFLRPTLVENEAKIKQRIARAIVESAGA